MQYDPDDNSIGSLPMGHNIHAHSNKSRGYAP